MPMTPPPPPLSKEQFDTAIRRGARTMREIDPRLAEWYDSQLRMSAFRAAVIVLGVAGLSLLVALLVAAEIAK